MQTGALVEAVDLETAEHDRVSLVVRRGEIVSLFAPEGRRREALLRTIAGIEPPASGGLRLFGAPRIALVRPSAAPLGDAASGTDLLIVDAEAPLPSDEWERLLAARGMGNACLLATRDANDAYRCDRATLALWGEDEAGRELASICERMRASSRELSDLLHARRAGSANVSAYCADLQRLNAASRDLLDEVRRYLTTSREARVVPSSRPPRALAVERSGAEAVRPRVLIIDDEPLIRHLFLRGLPEFHVEEASSAEATLERIERGDRFDAIVTDVNLGAGMSGVELAEAVARIDGVQAHRIVIISGRPLLDDVDRRLGLPVVLKPFSLIDLRSLLTYLVLHGGDGEHAAKLRAEARASSARHPR